MLYMTVVVRKIGGFLRTFLFLAFFLSPPPLFAYWVWSPESGKFVNPETEVKETPQEQYDYALEFYKKKNFKQATGHLRLLLKKYPGAQVAPEAQYRLGVIYEERGDYYKAFRAYRDLLQRYPQTERMSEVIEKEFRIGNVFLSGRRAKMMGFAILPSGPRAIEVFKHISEVAPYSEYGEKAEFHLGLAYKKTNQFEEAIQAFQQLIDQHPESKLVPQARFQIADTSYLQSVAATRDQRVIDRAAQEIDHFLAHYPDSSISDKAARLRQEIDEKNAEKNYRIALFYEKENFLDSAFIYYRDVAQRYPQTRWGPKAKERLGALERPAEFLKSQEAGIASKKEKILGEIRSVGDSEEARKKELEWQLKKLEKEEKEIKKSKPETLKRRKAALRQKEKELQEKWKALQKKRRRFAKNPSEDLHLTFDRWEASLEKEKADLAHEKLQIESWGKSLGVRTTPLLREFVPFAKGSPSPVEQVEQVETKRFKQLAHQKKKILEEKEGLYRQYEKLLGLKGFPRQAGRNFETTHRQLETQAREIENLEKKLEEKERLYKEHFGTPAWQALWRVPTGVLGRSAGVLNPFEGVSRREWRFKSAEGLKRLEREWQQKVSDQQVLVEAVAKAFDDELARAEENRLTVKAEGEGTDAVTLRRAIKQHEREIRGRYNEIQDRDDRKNELLEELERTLHEGKKRTEGPVTQTGKILTAPARGIYAFSKSFLFGLPEKDVQLTREANRPPSQGTDSADVRALREQIELESLLIEARNQEIEKLKRELETLRAEASLAGGVQSRPLLVKVPYVFIREAIVSANRLVPKKDRKEKLIGQLNRETERLERLKKELLEIENLLQKKGKKGPLEKKAAPHREPSLDPNTVRDEILSLHKQLEVQKTDFAQARENFEKNRWDKLSKGREKVRTEKRKRIEGELIELIEAEQRIDEEEKEILAKKKEMAERLELHHERDQINAQLNEIEKRKSALGEESRRFRSQTLPSP